jgi:hypothetical protein
MVVDLFLYMLHFSLQYMFKLPLEVVGPGGSLSTLLVATPYWQDASRRWTAMATAANKIRLDNGGTHLLAGGRLITGVDFKLCDYHIIYLIFLNILPYSN